MRYRSCDAVQQREQRRNLNVRKRLVAVVVELDSERNRIQIGVRAPLRLAGVPCARPFLDKLVNCAVAPDQVMRAYPPLRIGQRAQRLLGRIVARGVDNDKVGPPLVEIRRWPPLHR